MTGGALLGCVAMGEDQNHPRRFLRCTCIDRSDRSLSDRRLDHEAIRRVAGLLNLVRITCAASNFKPSIAAIERLAADALAACPAPRPCLAEGIRREGCIHFPRLVPS